MKFVFEHLQKVVYACRAPHGARGLKSSAYLPGICILQSRPTRGAWIEIMKCRMCPLLLLVAPHTGRVD